jgi:hypothetical protein
MKIAFLGGGKTEQGGHRRHSAPRAPRSRVEA